MKERLAGERFVPDEHSYLPTDDELTRMGVREVSPLREIKGIQGPDFYTQYFEQDVKFEDGWEYRMTHTKIPREYHVTDLTAMMTTPWTVRRNGFVQHQMQTVSEFGMDVTLGSTPLNLDRAAGDYEANARNYARMPRLAATILGERDKKNGIVIGDSRAANYGEGVEAYGPEHGFDAWYGDLRVASQIYGIPEVQELKDLFNGMSPQQTLDTIRRGDIPAHMNPLTLGKLVLHTVQRINSTFSPEFGPLVDLIKDPVVMLAEGKSLAEVKALTANKLSRESLDLPPTALRHYLASFDYTPRGAYRQAMEFLPLTDGSYGRAVDQSLRRHQLQYISVNEEDGLSIAKDVIEAHKPEEFTHTITNMVTKARHMDVIRGKSHTDRVQRLGSVIIPIIAEHGEWLKTLPPAERSAAMHSLAARALPAVFKGTESVLPEDMSVAA